MSRTIAMAAALLLALSVSVQAAPEAVPVHPAPGSTISDRTPTIAFNLSGDPNNHQFEVTIDRIFEFTSEEEAFLVSGGLVTWDFPAFLNLENGMHNVTVVVHGPDGATRLDWNFTVDPAAAKQSGEIKPLEVLVWVGVVLGTGMVAAATYAGYLWRAKGYSWTKFQIRFPRVISRISLYFPLVAAASVATAGLTYVATSGTSIRFLAEYILVGAAVLGTAPFTLQTLSQRRRRRSQERAFAQFLFELADAMRGGIDPIKAIRDLGASGTGPLRRPLKVAADGLRTGRPLNEVLENFADMTKSTLVGRYTGLVAEAARAGGDISMVVYQAAKDMDELTKIEAERAAAMRAPVMTMYIAFGVLFMITTTLVDFAPKLAEIDFASLAGDPESSEDPYVGPSLDLDLMTTRFFHLLLIASMGTGLLVGAFTEGNVRYGLHHMALMALLSGIGFPLVAL